MYALTGQRDDAPAGLLGEADTLGVHGRGSAGSGQGDAQGLEQGVHGRGGAHDHAVARPAEHGIFRRTVRFGRDGARGVLGGKAAAIGARAHDFAAKVPVERRAPGENHGGYVCAAHAHERSGRGFVAVDEEDDAVERLAADHLLGVHGCQVAVEHGGGVEVDLAQGDGGKLQREAACLPHAAFDGLG